MDKRIHVYYSGNVQGVGFRFTVERLAYSSGLTGWVENIADGRVEAVCEGNEISLKEFLRRVGEIFKEYISDVNVEWSNATGEFSGFGIR